jgi:2-dehydropantoate 2-reductase
MEFRGGTFMQTADVSRDTIYSLSTQQDVNGNSSSPNALSAASSNRRAKSLEPGIILHHQFNRLIIGEPDGSHSNRVMALNKALTESGIDAPVRDNIRWNIWLKLWGNVCFNPISALTGATLDRITSEPGLLALCKKMMFEAKAVNEALGIQIPTEMMDRRLTAAGSVAGHKMSMLQDLERGQSLEIDALVTAVQELGRLIKTPTPIIDAVLTLIQERGRAAHLY